MCIRDRLGLGNIEVLHARAEDMEAGPFDTVLARAVAPPAELLGLAEPLVAPGGRLVLLTGEDRGREIVSLARGFSALPVDSPVKALKRRIVVLERASMPESSDLR